MRKHSSETLSSDVFKCPRISAVKISKLWDEVLVQRSKKKRPEKVVRLKCIRLKK
jgi:hypothetical protein